MHVWACGICRASRGQRVVLLVVLLRERRSFRLRDVEGQESGLLRVHRVRRGGVH